MEIELAYHPIQAIDEGTYNSYLLESGLGGVPQKMVVEPFETALKNDGREEFNFGDIGIKRTEEARKTTSWQKVYASLLEFLRIRADDSRAVGLPDVSYVDGIGYCVTSHAVREFIQKQQERYASENSGFCLSWPGKRKAEAYPTDILVPDRDFSLLTEENAKLALRAKRFCSGLESGVTEAFKKLNQQWHAQETGHDKDNLPTKVQSPLKRVRRLAQGKYVFVALVREEVPEYKEILASLKTELGDMEEGIALPQIKSAKGRGGAVVSIKNLLERLEIERLKQDDLVKVKGRYEIVP